LDFIEAGGTPELYIESLRVAGEGLTPETLASLKDTSQYAINMTDSSSIFLTNLKLTHHQSNHSRQFYY
jgi:hypothetical protein